MSFPEQHEMHQRRFGRNLGLGIVLAGFIVLIFALTIAKASRDGEQSRTDQAMGQPLEVEN